MSEYLALIQYVFSVGLVQRDFLIIKCSANIKLTLNVQAL